MNSTIHHINIDCIDPYRLAAYWAGVLGLPMDPDDKPGDDEALLELGEGMPGLLFMRRGRASANRNFAHFDLRPLDQTRDEEIERLAGLGATPVKDQRNADGTGWMVMTDPEGNAFCVERSARERGEG